MHFKMSERSSFCFLSSSGIETASLITVEAVVCIVDINWHIGVSRIDSLHIRHRDVSVQFAEMQDGRNLGFQRIGIDDAAAIIAAGTGNATGIGSTHPGKQATKAVSDYANFALAAQLINRSLQVLPADALFFFGLHGGEGEEPEGEQP